MMKEDLLEAVPVAPRTAEAPSSRRRILYPWDVLLPVSIVFWAFGISQTHITQLGQYGLPVALPAVYYVGIALAVISTGWALAMADLWAPRLAAHLITFVVMLYGTAPLVYEESRYSWLFKYIGVVQYVNANGHVNQRIDIFQNWPGFFAFIAWFDKAIGINTAVGYAKWAQVVFELLTCLMLSFVFRALPLSVRERWLALFLYAGSIWIAQDYLSPQALGVVLSAGIFGLVLTYLSRTDEARWLVWLRRRFRPVSSVFRRVADRLTPRPKIPLDPSGLDASGLDASGLLAIPKSSRAQDGAIVAAICAIFFVLTFEHELSPYVVLIQLACLAAIGRMRHRWVVFVFAAIALGYFAPRFGFVNNKFGIIASIGNFFGNASPPLASLGTQVTVTKGVILSSHGARGLTVGMWGLAAVGAVRRWHDRRPTLALVLLAYSPALVFFAGAYGNEGLLRVFLFSLPWSACLAASAVKPVPGSLRKLGVLRAPLTLAVVVILFFPAFFGDDSSYYMSPSEVQGALAFYRSAAPGEIFAADGNFPQNINARYPLFPGGATLYGPGGLLEGPVSLDKNGVELTQVVERTETHPNQPAYIFITDSMEAFGIAFGFLHPNELETLTKTLDASPEWIHIYHNAGTDIFELPPTG